MKGQWCETPYFDVAIARVAMENLSDVRVHDLTDFQIVAFFFRCKFSVGNCCVCSLFRDDTLNITRTQKTKFISCKQKRPLMRQTRRLVLLLAR